MSSTTARTLAARKRIALVAHDHMKSSLVAWVRRHRDALAAHSLLGTGTTAALVAENTGLQVDGLMSGPMGGDQQLGARIAEATVDVMIFFWDPLQSVPHDPDVKALLRLATVWNIPTACNAASADFLMASPLMSAPYQAEVMDYGAYMKSRVSGS
jgi:methylglyoxal synthase